MYYYCQELSQNILNLLKTSNERLKLIKIIELNFEFVYNRLNSILISTLNVYLNMTKMCFNDIQYTFIACNLMFLKDMIGFIENEELKSKFNNTINLLNNYKTFLNCYLHKIL